MGYSVIWWHGAHTTHRNLYHIVFVPKYRRAVLRGKLVRRLQHLWYECCKINKWYIHELQIMPDHVHILIQLPPRISVSKAVQYLKGGSSKVIRREYPELEEWLWGDSLWQDGSFSETVGRGSEDAMRAYIQKQWEREP
jgi:putative transposase